MEGVTEMNTLTFLYIDPGTGSMLLSLFLGIATAAVFGIRALFIKLQVIFSGGRADKTQSEKQIPYVIYSDHKRYWNVFKPICDEFEKRGIDLLYLTQSDDDPALSQKYNHVKVEFIGEGNKGFARLNFLKAEIFLSTTPGLDVYQWKKSKSVKWYVHIPHSADELAGYRMFGLDYYDAVLTTGENQVELIRKIEDLRPSITKKEIVTVGSVPLDNLKKRYDSVQKNKQNEKPVVLLAPSWGPSGILSRYGAKLLSALQQTNFKIIVRPHPQTVVSEKNILEPLEKQFSNIEWNYDNDNFDVLNKTDLLITDFSGIIFDFACVFDKPLIYTDTNFDTLPYDADWIDEPRWGFKVLAEIGIRLEESDFANIENIINCAMESKNLQGGRNKIRQECWENIGNSAAKTVDYLIKKQMEISNI